MSNIQTITGTVKYYADPSRAKDHGYGPRFNALLITPNGEQRIYAGVGTEPGNLMAQHLGQGSKGKQVSVLVDGSYNFKGMAGGAPRQRQNGNGTSAPPADLYGKDRVNAYANLLKMCHDMVHEKFEGAGLPVDQEVDILTKYTQTLYISLTR